MTFVYSHARMRASAGWFVLSLCASCCNDALMKGVSPQLNAWQVACLRCLFGTLTLLPYLGWQGRQSFRTVHLRLHVLRGTMFFAGLALWSYGVRHAPMATATLVGFTVPLFVLLLAPVVLKERVESASWLAGFGGLVGIATICTAGSQGLWTTNALVFLAAAFLFALLDVLNKKYISRESMSCMLFYSTLTATVLLTFPALYTTTHFPDLRDILLLWGSGMGGNVLLYALLKALEHAPASRLAPLRYLEILLSAAIGYVAFGEVPTMQIYRGGAIILLATFLTAYRKN